MTVFSLPFLRKALPWLGGLAAAVFVVGVCVFVVRSMNRAEAAGNRHEAQVFHRANTICGAPPARIKTHGSGWSLGPWIEVFCQDGTTRAITL